MAINKVKYNKNKRKYYWEHPIYREKKKQKMREYSMNQRIKGGVWGNINSIIKIMRGF